MPPRGLEPDPCILFFRLMAFYETIYLFTNRGPSTVQATQLEVCNRTMWCATPIFGPGCIFVWTNDYSCILAPIVLTLFFFVWYFCCVRICTTTTTHHTRHFCATLLYIFIEKGLFPTYCYVDLYTVVCLNCLLILITISRL